MLVGRKQGKDGTVVEGRRWCCLVLLGKQQRWKGAAMVVGRDGGGKFWQGEGRGGRGSVRRKERVRANAARCESSEGGTSRMVMAKDAEEDFSCCSVKDR